MSPIIKINRNQVQGQPNRYAVMRLFLFASTLLVASTTNAFQMVSTPPNNKAYKNPRIGSKLRYSTTDDVPQAATTSEFDSKVRNMMITTQPKEQSKPKQKGLPNMGTASSKDELRKAVLENEDRLTVVRFHAPYCAQCKKMEPLLRSFARRNPDIQFIDVAYTQDASNRHLIHSLGVPSFPYCHVYHPKSLGLLEEHSINSKHFQDVAKVIESYQDGGCDLPPHPNDEGVYGSPYKTLKNTAEAAATR